MAESVPQRNVGHPVLLSTTDTGDWELVVRDSARHWLASGNNVVGLDEVNTASATSELIGAYCTTPLVPSATVRK